MTQLEDIKLMNKSMILYLKKIGKNARRNEIIDEVLKDDTCFFRISKDDAYMILEDIGVVKDKIDLVYSDLISSDNYYSLQRIGKIDEKDENIVVKYKNYDYNDLFKDRKKEEKITENNNSVVIYKETFIDKIINKIKSFFKIS